MDEFIHDLGLTGDREHLQQCLGCQSENVSMASLRRIKRASQRLCASLGLIHAKITLHFAESNSRLRVNSPDYMSAKRQRLLLTGRLLKGEAQAASFKAEHESFQSVCEMPSFCAVHSRQTEAQGAS